MSPTQIAQLATPALLAYHNELAAKLGKTPTKRFPTRTDGIRRTAQLAAQLHLNGGTKVEAADTMLSAPKSDRVLRLEVAEARRVNKAVMKATRVLVNAAKVDGRLANADKKPSVSARCRELFTTHDNAAIFAILQAEYGLDDKKRGYPAWYRADAKRRGS